MTEIILRSEGKDLRIALDRSAAPTLTSAIVGSLPQRSILVHAQTAGDELCVPLDFYHGFQNRRVPRKGDVGYASAGCYLCVYYGQMSPWDGETNIVGHVATDPGSMVAFCTTFLFGGGAHADLVLGQGSVNKECSLPVALSGSDKLPWINSFLRSTLVWTPKDIRDLCATPTLAMGNMAARLQASMLLQSLAETVFVALRTVEADAAALNQTSVILSTCVSRACRSLAMLGMRETTAQLDALAKHLHQPPSTHEFHELCHAAVVGLNRLRFWAEAVAPWPLVRTLAAEQDANLKRAGIFDRKLQHINQETFQ